MLTPSAAAAIILAEAPRLATRPLALRDAAGQILQQDIFAERDQPPFDRVSMDGIAVASNSTAREFRIVGTQAAGAAPLTLENIDTCIEAMTGAMLPIGCDCVIPVEKLSIRNQTAVLADDVVLSPWMNLHRRGMDCRAGARILAKGTRLGAPEVAAAASAGLVHVHVSKTPSIVIVSTGDELVEPGQPVSEWQIRRSNVYGISAALRAAGFLRVADDHIVDDEEQLRKRLGKHLETADVVILSGGVSMGKFDYVPKILAELGVRPLFHKIAQRPGKPMWFGVLGEKAVYALPGNPVSTLACFARYVLPGLYAAMRAEYEPNSVELAVNAPLLPSLTTLLPVSISELGGKRLANPRPTQGSGDFTSLVGSTGCVELPPGTEPLKAGTVVKFYRW